MMTNPPDLPFIHLRARSAYSLLRGGMHVKDLVAWAAQHNMPALGLTDEMNLFGSLEFSEYAVQAGVQPILGLTLPIYIPAERSELQRKKPAYIPSLALFAQNEEGREHLMRLSSLAYLQHGNEAHIHVTLEELSGLNGGLIVLTGGPSGPIDHALRNGQQSQAQQICARLKEFFPDRFYVELQRGEAGQPHPTEAELLRLAQAQSLPIVATNDSYFLPSQNWLAHDALLCIEAGRYLTEENREKSGPHYALHEPQKMQQNFADLPAAIRNTAEIALRCAVKIEPRQPHLPRFDVGEGRDEAEELALQAKAGLETKLQQIELVADQKIYEDRLAFELKVITEMGFPGYFLIVSDFIKWAKGRQIAVGPGRGSGAGSLVAYSLEITNLDPLRFGLLFERFLNPERVSMPDFDIDFCQERRGEVIDYVQQRYGKERVAQIITFGSLQARVVVRDVGRVMQLPLGLVDRLAKMIPNNPASPTSLGEAIEIEPRIKQLSQEETGIDELLSTALELEGLYRNASTHAAGVVIADRELTELSPLYLDPRSDIPATQFNMKWVEVAGLVKFDFLGLKTLTVIQHCLKFIEQNLGEKINIDNIPLNNAVTYELLASGDTVGVFQLEGSGMREVLRKMHADCLEDIIALISLYRPGPMKNIDTYVRRKMGEEQPDYLHDMLEPILKETHGVIIYQEQVMQIAQTLSGYSLGEADLLRRAMGKKKKEEMDQQQERFVEGACANGVTKDRAQYIFDLVQEFAGYGFNKSHAAAYALIAYQTGYLKANYRTEFLAASMNLDSQNTDKLAFFVRDAREKNIEVIPPDIGHSQADFSVQGKKILYALGAIKNVGAEAMRHVVAEREASGGFQNINEFVCKVDAQHLNKRMIENLTKAGAFDSWDGNRACFVQNAELIVKNLTQNTKNRESAQSSLFGGEAEKELGGMELVPAQSWTRPFALEEERKALGFYLSGHPLSQALRLLPKNMVTLAQEIEGKLQASGGSKFRGAGVVRAIQKRISGKNGKRFAFVTLSDPTGEYEIFASEEILQQAGELISVGAKIAVSISAKLDAGNSGSARLFAESVEPFSRLSSMQSSTALTIFVAPDCDWDQLAQAIPVAAMVKQEERQVPALSSAPYCFIKLRLDIKDQPDPVFRLLLKTQIDFEYQEKIAAIDGVIEVSRSEKGKNAQLQGAA